MNFEEKKAYMNEIQLNLALYEAMEESINYHFNNEWKERALKILWNHHTYFDDYAYIPSLRRIKEIMAKEDEEKDQ